MKTIEILCFHLILFIFINQKFSLATLPVELASGLDITIDVKNISYFEINYLEYFVLSQYTTNEFHLNFDKDLDNNYAFSIFQVHAFEFNVTLSYGSKTGTEIFHNGTNLGFVIQENILISVKNSNYHTNVTIVVIIIHYDKYSPMPGGCNIDYRIRESPVLLVSANRDIIQVDTPTAANSIALDPGQQICSQENLIYESFFKYLPKSDMTAKTYFKGIISMVELLSLQNNASKANKLTPGPVFRRLYIAYPGTGIIFNTVVRNKNGIAASYIPAVSYSCTPPSWESNCTFILSSIGINIFAIILVMVGAIQVFVFFKAPVFDLFVDTVLLGSYLAYHVLNFFDCIREDMELIVSVLIGLLLALILTLIGVFSNLSLIFNIVSKLLFSLIIAAIVLFLIEGNEIFIENTAYWMVFTLVFVAASITFLRIFTFLSIFIFVSIGAYNIILGIQLLVHSNAVLVWFNHFRRISNPNFKYTNGTVNLDNSDIYLSLMWIIIVILGIFFQHKKYIKHNDSVEVFTRLNENTPLITRWTNGSDEVFETPESNSKFLRRMDVRNYYSHSWEVE